MSIKGNMMGKKSNFFKKPSEYEQKIGQSTIVIHIRDVDNLSATCVAMDRAAKAEERDNLIKKSGRNDYIPSLKEIFNAFDTFIREYRKENHGAGWKEFYDLSKPHHLTIFLLWQIRNF